jgi:homocitrate synthase NifV
MSGEKRKIYITDSTLRDGQQSPGLAFSLETRVKMIKALDDLGVSRIEALTPGMRTIETERVKELGKTLKNAQIVSWNRLNLGDLRRSSVAEPHIYHICFPASELQLDKKMRMTFDMAAALLSECVSVVRAKGCGLSVGLEDISRASKERTLRVISLLKKLGVVHVRLSDTAGVLTPLATEDLTRLFVGEGFTVEFHAHNDLGMANANTLISVLSGASYVDATLLGVGERAGNACMSDILRILLECRDITFLPNYEEAIEIEESFRSVLIRDDYIESLIKSYHGEIPKHVVM